MSECATLRETAKTLVISQTLQATVSMLNVMICMEGLGRLVKLKHIITTISYELSSTVVEWARPKDVRLIQETVTST